MMETQKYMAGQRVKFQGRHGVILEGTIERVNTKTVSIKTANSGKWRVSPVYIEEVL
jgi:hypothetical protein